MILINLVKVVAIRLTDIVNRLIDPFEAKTFDQRSDLVALEEKYSKHLEANFKNQGWFLYQKPMPSDAGDQVLFQGLYTGMLAVKGANLDSAYYALDTLFIGDRLIRGWWADLRCNDTASNDSATGALFALYCIWQYRDSRANGRIVKWAQRVIDDGYALADLNGVPTKYGRLEQGWKTDPLRITLLLALLSLAAKIDRNAFENHYETLYNKYRELLPYAKVKLLWWDTDYDTHRAAIHLHILWQLTRDTTYRDGLRRLHRITKKSNNAWVQCLCSPVLELNDIDLSILNTFSDRRLEGNIATKNSGTVDTVRWGRNTRARQTLSIWRRGSQDFFWQRNMFACDEWGDFENAAIFHTGLDYLLAYHMAKRMGLTRGTCGVILPA